MDENAYVVDRESRARFGRVYEAMLFMDFSLNDALHMRGPCIAPNDRWHSRPNPFTDRSRPLRVMLDPTLDHEDENTVRALQASCMSEVAEVLRVSRDPHPSPSGAKTVELEDLGPQGDGVHGWEAHFGKSSTWVSMSDDYLEVARHVFGPLTAGAAHTTVLAAHTHEALGCDVFLTTNRQLVDRRGSLSGWAGRLAPIAPEELARFLGILLRQQGVLPTSTQSWVRGGVYEATVQDWLPSYLSLYRLLAAQPDTDRTLDYLEGLLGNCALAVMALDRLAVLHFAEDTSPANNSSSAQQQYESASLVIAASAALESLTWVLFTLAGAQADRRGVSFRKIVDTRARRKNAAWVERVSDFCPVAVSTFRKGFVPTLVLVVHHRDLLQHHVPIPAAVGVFGRLVRVNGEERLVNERHIGILRTEPHPGEAPRWPSSREAMGILPDAVMPYPFFRSAVHETLSLVQAVLSELSSRLGASGANPANPHYTIMGEDTNAGLPRFLALSL
jgi:hypothetical protein